MASSVSQFFDRYAVDFDSIYGTRHTPWNRAINHWLRRAMRLRFERSLKHCDPIQGKSVLDIGCGPGHYSVALATRGASQILGIDFAPTMIELSKARAERHAVADRCRFMAADFMQARLEERFDYAVVMGVMDYIADPLPLVKRVLQTTNDRALFSFPVAGGVLAWQRKIRYRSRCELHFYTQPQIESLFAAAGAEASIERISRDFFVAARLLQPQAGTTGRSAVSVRSSGHSRPTGVRG